MLQVPNRYIDNGTYGGHKDDEPITRPIITALRRHLRVLLACIGLGIAAGALYVIAAQPSYTAVATLILDAGASGLQEGQASTSLALDGSAVDSQVEIITSGRITSLVVDKLDLANDLDLARSSFIDGLLAPARQLISSLMPQREPSAVSMESAQRQAVLRRVSSKLSARRIGRSYLIEIGFRHPNPVRAALIANSFAGSYLDDLLAAKYAAAQRGTEWLEKRVDELRQKSFQSELAVQEFRAEQVLRSGMRQSGGDPIVEKIVTLRELERAAETSRLVFQNYLQRYQAALQQQSAPMTEARLLTEALPPVSSSNPNLLVVTLTAIFGFIVGGIAIFIREGSEIGFRTRRQMHEFLRIEFLGNIPKLRARRILRFRRPYPGGSAKRLRLMSFEESLLYPTSIVGETLRSIKVAADDSSGDSAVIVGITSTLSGEGATTLAKDFASFLARLGHKTILIDGNLRDRGLTRDLAPDARSGLAEVLNGGALKEHSLYEEASRLTILPAPDANLSHVRDRLGSEDMREMLKRLRGQFRYVVIDLPPIGLSSDSKAVAANIDCAVLAVEWGTTPADAVQEALRHNGPLTDKWIGAVLTKVDMARLDRY